MRVVRRFWPWVLYGWALDALRSRYRKRKERKRRKVEASRPRLSQTRRSRSLTVGFSEGQAQNIQSHSRLFTMLPLEIRLQIYEWVLGRRTVHFRRPCRHTVPETVALQPYWCEVKGEKDHPVHPRDDLTRDVYCEFGIPSYKHAPSPTLLRTCCRVYCESINVLYSNIVHIREELRVLHVLESALPPQRFLSIRRIEVLCEFIERNWGPFCESLKHLSNLEYCQIWLFGHGRPGLLTPSESCRALESLLTIPRMREFRVFLATQDITDVAEKFRGAPFRLDLCEPVTILDMVSCAIGEQC